MYRKQIKEENHRSRKGHHNMPSFSSTLLDEIYRSIDGNLEKTEELKGHRDKAVRKQGGYRAKASGNKIAEDEETARFERACLVQKWMEKDNDVLFFSSTSSSSDSSGQLSSSDTEFFGSQTKRKVSGLPTRPKPVRTGAPTRKHEQQEDSYLFDDYQNHDKKFREDEINRAKSRALKIYANLKKMKQPISPGGRLTSFIISLFNNPNGKKVKNVDSGKVFQDMKSSKPTSACSSASSFSRSCLSKCSPKSREKMQRTVRFHPTSVIVDQDSRPCVKRSIYDEDMDRYGRPPLPPNAIAELKQSIEEKNRRIEEAAHKVLQGYNRQNKDNFSMFRKIHGENAEYDDEEEDDAMSDSSSDLFEIDHLSMFSKNTFCEKLPVYETTHFSTSRAISSGLIR